MRSIEGSRERQRGLPAPGLGKQGGRPVKLDRKGRSRLKRFLATGKTQAECAAVLSVSLRTVGRVLAGMHRGKI
jgi:hypothetical protein